MCDISLCQFMFFSVSVFSFCASSLFYMYNTVELKWYLHCCVSAAAHLLISLIPSNSFRQSFRSRNIVSPHKETIVVC